MVGFRIVWYLIGLTTLLFVLALLAVNNSGPGKDSPPPQTTQPTVVEKSYFDYRPTTKLPYDPNVKRSDKWIVVTTINQPTEAVKKLAQLEGWRVVVVADRKTPTNWEFKNCDFLSVEKQKSLGYQVTDLLPWNHYARKNVGYLYAIQNGAKLIYETDDDNILNQDSIVYLPETSSLSNVVPQRMESGAVNPYAHFGEPTIWPRGYPLERVQEAQSYSHYRLTKTLPTTISIQQGLANKDPDVDAIFRLTRPLGITFKQDACPIAYPSTVMSPFNSQNTVFYQRAFWGLMIPITTTFRVCDIWRGYWAQRLLWDLGASLAFLPPSVIQNRNPHHLLEDFVDEEDLYRDAGKLVKFLRSWTSDRESFFDRTIDLSLEMYRQGFWDEGDVALTRAWLHDLMAVGYKEPKLNLEYYYEGLGDAVKQLPSPTEAPVNAICGGDSTSEATNDVATSQPASTVFNRPSPEELQFFTVLLDGDPQLISKMRNFVGYFHKQNFTGRIKVFHSPAIPRPILAEVGNWERIDLVDLKSVVSTFESYLTKQGMDQLLAHVGKTSSKSPVYLHYSVLAVNLPTLVRTLDQVIKETGYAGASTGPLRQISNQELAVRWINDEISTLMIIGGGPLSKLVSDVELQGRKFSTVIRGVEDVLPPDEPPWCRVVHKYLYPPMNKKENQKAVNNTKTKICLLVPTLGKTQSGTWAHSPDEVEAFQKFVPGFVSSLVPDYEFSIYFGFDIGDLFYDSVQNQKACKEWINSQIMQRYTQSAKDLKVHVIMKSYPKCFSNNVFFWNHLAEQAYQDGCDYNLQLGDDMVLHGNGWKQLIDALQKTIKPNFGVVSPRHHGGTMRVHVMSFVHRSHYEMFGHHFPPEYYNWWADDWMTYIYGVYDAALWLDPGAAIDMDHIVHQRYSACHSHKYWLLPSLVRTKSMMDKWLVEQFQAGKDPSNFHTREHKLPALTYQYVQH